MSTYDWAKKVVVTGGSGQLGTLVLRRLCADRKVKEVVSLDVRPPIACGTKLRAHIADVRDRDIARHFDGATAVVHLAFLVTGWPTRDVFDSVNIGGSRNVFLATVASGAKSLVYASSIAAYGVLPGHPVPIVETTPRRLADAFAYSAAKYQVEEILDRFEEDHPSIAVARFRPGILVGTHMEHALGATLSRRLLVASGESPWPIVWDEDVADAIVLALRSGARGAYNLGAEDARPARELAQAAGLRMIDVPRAVRTSAARVLPLVARLRRPKTDPAWLEAADVPMIMSSEKARAELGWKPTCPNAIDVMRRYVELAPRVGDRSLDAFFRAVTFRARRIPPPPDAVHVVQQIHLSLTGADGGDFQLLIDHGRLTAMPGIPRPPSAVVTMRASLFRELVAGRTDFASAQLTGRIRIEGEAMAAMVIQSLVATFRATASKPGRDGWVARKLEGWVTRAG